MKIEMVRLFDIYAPLFNERQQEILTLYYNEDESLAEISENVGITRQGVRDCIVKAEAQLCSYEAALGLYERSRRHEKALSELIDKAEADGVSSDILNKIKELGDIFI